MANVLIIAATSDIAFATARVYAAHGYDLYLAARKPAELDARAADLRIRSGRDVRCFELDVLDFTSHASFVDSLPELPDGILCAAGYLGDQGVAQHDFAEARKIIDTNYTGPASLIEHFATRFESRGSGFIVGVSSVAGDRGRRSNYFYGAAKAAFSTYLSGLRNRLASSSVVVLTVKPGFVATRMTADMDLPPRLTAQPEDVGAMIYKAQQRGRSVLYVRWMWRWIMLVIRLLPEPIFKKTNF